jgi:hypothetical protein
MVVQGGCQRQRQRGLADAGRPGQGDVARVLFKEEPARSGKLRLATDERTWQDRDTGVPPLAHATPWIRGKPSAVG